FFFLANLFFEPVQVIGNQYNQALSAMAGGERYFRLIDTRPDWQDTDAEDFKPQASPGSAGVPAGPFADRASVAPGGGAPALTVEFENVSFAYKSDRPVLMGFSFVAKPGQTVALVGQTGSGKT